MNKQVRTLPRDYTAAELDQGIGMTYHPVTRAPLHRAGLTFDHARGLFHYFGGSSWMCWEYDEPRIGDGTARSAGDQYPQHWKVDPFSGELL